MYTSLSLDFCYKLALLMFLSAGGFYLSGCNNEPEKPKPTPSEISIVTPSAPSGLKVVAGDKQAILTWTRVHNADSYNLYLATEPGVDQQSYKNLANGKRQDSVNSPLIITELDNSVTYYLILTSKNASGESSPSQEIKVSPLSAVPIPATPEIPRANAVGNKVNLRWKKVPGALRYQVHVSYPEDAKPNLRGSTQQYTVPDAFYSIASLERGKTYFFAVSAENEAGASGISDSVSVEIKKPALRPATPTGLSASANYEDSSISLNWMVADNIEQYTLIMSTDPNVNSENYLKLANGRFFKDVLPPYTLPNMAEDTYYFVLTAKSENTVSRDSRMVSVVLKSPVAEPAAEPLPNVQANSVAEPAQPEVYLPFDKLSSSGKLLAEQQQAYKTQPWACVRNKKTGVMWEVKTRDKSFRSQNNAYQWSFSGKGTCPDGVCDVQAYIKKLNNMRLCGVNNWRLPNREELSSLIDRSQPYPIPKIDTRFFVNTGNLYYWTSTSYEHDNNLAWFVYYASGYGYFDLKSTPMHIRLISDPN